MAEKVLLKKYANRRLYDTEKSAYVSLSQVADTIKQGRQVHVIEAKTKEDVTSFVLTQIVLDQARTNNFFLPAPLLHLIIQYGDNVLAEFFEKYLQQAIEGYLAYKSTVDEQFRTWLELGLDFSGMAQKTMVDIGPLQSFFDLFHGSKGNKESERQEEDS